MTTLPAAQPRPVRARGLAFFASAWLVAAAIGALEAWASVRRRAPGVA